MCRIDFAFPCQLWSILKTSLLQRGGKAAERERRKKEGVEERVGRKEGEEETMVVLTGDQFKW